MSATATEAPRRPKPQPVDDWRDGLSPAEQLRVQLTWAKRRGRAFDEAWPLAVSRLRWPGPKWERDLWKAIIDAGEHVWRSAYQGGAARDDSMRRLTGVMAA